MMKLTVGRGILFISFLVDVGSMREMKWKKAKAKA